MCSSSHLCFSSCVLLLVLQGYYPNRPAIPASAPRVPSSGPRPVAPHVYPASSQMMMISQQQIDPFCHHSGLLYSSWAGELIFATVNKHMLKQHKTNNPPILSDSEPSGRSSTESMCKGQILQMTIWPVIEEIPVVVTIFYPIKLSPSCYISNGKTVARQNCQYLFIGGEFVIDSH